VLTYSSISFINSRFRKELSLMHHIKNTVYSRASSSERFAMSHKNRIEETATSIYLTECIYNLFRVLIGLILFCLSYKLQLSMLSMTRRKVILFKRHTHHLEPLSIIRWHIDSNSYYEWLVFMYICVFNVCLKQKDSDIKLSLSQWFYIFFLLHTYWLHAHQIGIHFSYVYFRPPHHFNLILM
jgi:hypothetical protein